MKKFINTENIITFWIIFRRWFRSRLIFHHDFIERFIRMPLFHYFRLWGVVVVNFFLILSPFHVILFAFFSSLFGGQFLPPFLASFLVFLAHFFVPLSIAAHLFFPNPTQRFTHMVTIDGLQCKEYITLSVLSAFPCIRHFWTHSTLIFLSIFFGARELWHAALPMRVLHTFSCWTLERFH